MSLLIFREIVKEEGEEEECTFEEQLICKGRPAKSEQESGQWAAGIIILCKPISLNSFFFFLIVWKN